MAYDFPNSPTLGQVYNGYTWDGEKWGVTFNAPNQGGVIAIKVFTASGTYTPSPNMTTCVIECQGGGGGGGGLVSVAGIYTTGAGGGAGAYAYMIATAATVGVSQTITIGAGGNGGAAGANNGGAGGSTSVGSLCAANGGAGGVYTQTGASMPAGGVAGSTGTGAVVITGNCGGGAVAVASGGAVGAVYGGGWGGASRFGGMLSVVQNTNGVSAPANSGVGGSGPQDITGGNKSGGNGGSGVVIITEYGLTSLGSSTAASGAVRYDLPQGLTANQQAQGRANIGALKKNYIINGAMMVSQENGATASNAALYYPADMFVFLLSVSTATIATQQNTGVTPAGSPNRVSCSVSVADAAMTTNKYSLLGHYIEGLRFADAKFGTAAAKTMTLQFGVKAPAGTYCVAFQNNGQNRTYVAEYTIAAGEANIDVIKSVTIPGDVAGTWVTDNTRGLMIFWTLMAGPSVQGPANVWTGTGVLGSPNQFNLFGTVGNLFQLFDVSLTEGTVAPPFVVPDYASELAACQRYWYCTNAASPKGVGTPAGVGSICGIATVTNAMDIGCKWAVRMRSLPSVTMWSQGVQNNVRTASGAVGGPLPSPVFYAFHDGLSFITTTVGTFVVGTGYDFDLIANARL